MRSWLTAGDIGGFHRGTDRFSLSSIVSKNYLPFRGHFAK